MELYELPFAKCIKLSDDTVEVIVNEGVEYDIDMLNQYHGWVKTHLKHPCYIMVNKINSYTYTFDVQRKIATIPEIKAVAHVVYNRASQVATEAMAELPRTRPVNYNIFSSREAALAWLDKQRSA